MLVPLLALEQFLFQLGQAGLFIAQAPFQLTLPEGSLVQLDFQLAVSALQLLYLLILLLTVQPGFAQFLLLALRKLFKLAPLQSFFGQQRFQLLAQISLCFALQLLTLKLMLQFVQLSLLLLI